MKSQLEEPSLKDARFFVQHRGQENRPWKGVVEVITNCQPQRPSMSTRHSQSSTRASRDDVVGVLDMLGWKMKLDIWIRVTYHDERLT